MEREETILTEFHQILLLSQILKSFFKHLFVFESTRERQSASRGEAERDEDLEPKAGSRLQAVITEPDAGLELTNREIM